MIDLNWQNGRVHVGFVFFFCHKNKIHNSWYTFSQNGFERKHKAVQRGRPLLKNLNF